MTDQDVSTPAAPEQPSACDARLAGRAALAAALESAAIVGSKMSSFVPPTREQLDQIAAAARASIRALEAERAAQAGSPCPRILQAAAFAADYVPAAYVVANIVQRQRLLAVTARTGGGKTAVTLTVALHVAAGRPIGRVEVERGSVLYLAAENPDDIRARLIFAAERLAIDLAAVPLHFVVGTFVFDDWRRHLEQEAARIGPLALVVVDTGPAFLSMQGIEDENANVAMLGFARTLRSLTELPGGPAVLVLVHPTKSAQGADQMIPRGGSAFLGELDGNLALLPGADGEHVELVAAAKFRGPAFSPVHFRLETGTCARLVDAHGRPIPSVLALPVDRTAVEAAETSANDELVGLLKAVADRPGAPLSYYARCAGLAFADGTPNRQKVARLLERLASDKLAVQRAGRWHPTKAGRALVERADHAVRAGG